MNTLNAIFNTCELTRGNLGTIAYYSHLIPIFLSLFIGIFVFVKAKYNLFSKIFLLFVVVFSLWLLGNFVGWTQNNYFLQYAAWAPMDYLETTMYILGLYFIMVFINNSDISTYKKIILFLITLTPFIISFTGKSVFGFVYPVCEVVNNNFLLNYRFIIQILVVVAILIFTIYSLFKKVDKLVKRSRLIVGGSMFLFLTIFGVTSYISALTGYYELSLYSLLIIPVFLLVIIYAVFELDIFHFKILGTQYLVVALMILISSQLFFVNGSTDRLLTAITVLLTFGLSMILFINFKRETDQRVYIEKLSELLKHSKKQIEEANEKLEKANSKLKDLDKLKTEFVSLASHQLRSPLTAIKGYASMLMEGDFGDINKDAKESIDRILESSNNLTMLVDDLLNVSKIEQGGMKYEKARFNLSKTVKDIAKDLSITADKKGIKLEFENDENTECYIDADEGKIRQVVVNLIDNSIKYTKEGWIKVKVEKIDTKILFTVKDSGVGINPEFIDTLFEKFTRGDGARMNTTGSGLGLYLVKEIVNAHEGKVWVESEGVGKGSTFYVEFDAY